MSLYKAKQIRKYKYCVGSCIITYNGGSITLMKENVTGIEISNDYINNMFPIFKLNLQVKEEDYYNIMKNKNNVVVHLKIQKYFKLDQGNKKKRKSSPKKTCLEGSFVLIMDEQDYERDRDISDKNAEVEGRKRNKKKNSKSSGDFDQRMELYLYRKEVATAFKKQVNLIFTKTNLISVIAYLLGEVGINNMLISPLENNAEISQLFIPPMTINRAIQYLDAMYGFYSGGSIIYYGLLYSYILNFNGKCTVFPPNDKKEVSFLIPKKTSIEGAQCGSVDKGDDKFYISWEYDQMSFSNETVTSDVIKGTDAMIINPNDASIDTSSSKAITNGTKNLRTIENSTMNKYLGKTHANQTSASANVITGSIADCDMEAFEPYRLYNFVFEDPKLVNKYNGRYSLSAVAFQFANEEGNGEFNLNVGLTLRKIENTSSTKKTM